jgi:hypothetical protein
MFISVLSSARSPGFGWSDKDKTIESDRHLNPLSSKSAPASCRPFSATTLDYNQICAIAQIGNNRRVKKNRDGGARKNRLRFAQQSLGSVLMARGCAQDRSWAIQPHPEH